MGRRSGGGGGAKSAAAQEQARQLQETLQRSAAIDRYVDLIPARFYLASDNQAVLDAKPGFDPGKVKTTSQIVAEAAVAQSRGDDEDGQGAGTAAGGKMTKAAKRRLQRRGGAKGAAAKPVSDVSSRAELHAKLERRIAELKDERRRRQSEKDKAANAARRPADSGAAPLSKQPGSGGGGGGGGGPEAGRLEFSQKESVVPFEAGVGRRGDKVRRLRSELRKQEAEAGKVRRAEAEGRGDEARKDLALQKALKRARGEKVHDDVGKLRKAQKSLEMKRKKGKDKWEQLKKEEKQQKDDKQQKRKENLAKPRGKKAKLRAEQREGFEGKHGASFINSEK